MQFFRLESVDSTNDEVRRRGDGLDNLSVVWALTQTRGRGQRGNRWESEPGKNLTFSVLVRPGEDGIPPVPARAQFVLSQAATLSVADCLRTQGIPARIKWPNDIYVGDRKICGMLLENTLSGEFVASSIIGIGLNVGQREFGSGLLNPTSMTLLSGREYALQPLLEDICGRLETLLRRPFDLEGAFLDLLYRKDERHAFTDCADGTVFEGTIKGISHEGLLRVEMPDGCLRDFSFKQISYIL